MAGDDVRALADLDLALTIDGNRPNTLYVRGLVKRRSGDAAGADADIAAAVKLAPTIAEDRPRSGSNRSIVN
jgi:hypothetical protein